MIDSPNPGHGQPDDIVGTRHHHWSGEPRDIGQQHGEAERSQIADFCEFISEQPSPWSSDDLPTKSAISEHVEQLLAATALYDPLALEELEGIADGANQDIAQIALLNAFLDLLPLNGTGHASDYVGCTTVGVGSTSKPGNPVLLGQNYDLWGALRPMGFTATIHRPDAPAALIFSFSGVLGCAGLNADGIGLGINYLDAGRVGTGVLYPAIVRRVLSQRRIGDAVGAIVLPRRGCSMHYMIGTADGVLIGLETTPESFAPLASKDTFIAHSNHFVSDQLLAADAMMKANPSDHQLTRPGSSIVRKCVAETRLNQNSERHTHAAVQQILTDHVNYPYSICFHGDAKLPDRERSQTIASMVLDLTNRTISISNGCHHSAYSEVSL